MLKSESTVHDYVLRNKHITEDEYTQWRKLTDAMTHSARMMGLSDSPFTEKIFRSALQELTKFEIEHRLSLLALEMSLSEIEDRKACCNTL